MPKVKKEVEDIINREKNNIWKVKYTEEDDGYGNTIRGISLHFVKNMVEALQTPSFDGPYYRGEWHKLEDGISWQTEIENMFVGDNRLVSGTWQSITENLEDKDIMAIKRSG